MVPYVRSLLSSVKAIADARHIAFEQRALAHREYRELHQQYERLEHERNTIHLILQHWIDHPETTFAEREELEQASAALRCLKGGEA